MYCDNVGSGKSITTLSLIVKKDHLLNLPGKISFICPSGLFKVKSILLQW